MNRINKYASFASWVRRVAALGAVVVLAAAFSPGLAKSDEHHHHGQTTFNFVIASAASNVFMIATTTDDHTTTRKVVARIPTEGPSQTVVSADGKTTYSVDSKNNVVVFSDGDKDDPDSIRVEEGPSGLALSLDGKKLFVFSTISNTISVIDTKEEKVEEVDPAPAYHFGVDVVNGNLQAVD